MERGGVYHVTSRGNNNGDVFVDDPDRLLFVDLLERAAVRCEWIVFAYCLMTTHYHLVVQVPTGALSKGMCLLNGDFARKTNRRHGRIGHAFNERFSSRSISRDSHLLEACRYVVLNPVRAGICAAPAAWPWSSYRACAGLDFAPAFLAQRKLLSLFGRSPGEARQRYVAFVSEGRQPVPGTGSGRAPRCVPGTGF